MYTPIKAMTVENTAAFSFKFANFAQTLVKSIVFGGTAKSPPKEVKCVHRHSVFHFVVPLPTCKNNGATSKT